MAGAGEVNPKNVLVEQYQRDSAEKFLLANELLNELPAEERSELLECIAQALSSAEITLFLSEPEKEYYLSIVGGFGREANKEILMWAEKTEEGIVCKLVLANSEDVASIFKKG